MEEKPKEMRNDETSFERRVGSTLLPVSEKGYDAG